MFRRCRFVEPGLLVQGMRFEGCGWHPKGPASIHRTRTALDQDGAVLGYAFGREGFSRVDIDINESDPVYRLAGRLIGMPLKPLQGFGVPAESYGCDMTAPSPKTLGTLHGTARDTV